MCTALPPRARCSNRWGGEFAEHFGLLILDSSLAEPDAAALIARIRTLPQAPPIALMHTLSSPRQGKDKSVFAGIPHLQKPLLQEDLLNAILIALGQADEMAHGTVLERGADSAPQRSLDILLVEDNPVNQTLAIRLLDKRGHHVHVVENGQLALDAVRNHAYDLIFMDIQMPVMGGFEATAAIRAVESLLERRTPIIAMTAHAMADDRERCLQAGMDDYISKPIIGNALDAALASIIGHNTHPGSSPLPAGNQGDLVNANPPFDRATLVESLGGDLELYAEIVQLFLNHCPSEIEALRRELAAGNADQLHRTAHSLKGAVSNFSAPRATEAARALELTTKAGLATNTPDLVEELIAAVEELVAALHKDLRKD